MGSMVEAGRRRVPFVSVTGAPAQPEGIVVGDDGVRAVVGGLGPGVPRLPRHRMGLPGRRGPPPVREAQPRGLPGGLSWLTILRKREAFRDAFGGFDYARVARFDERDVERLLADASIVRHRGKIEVVDQQRGSRARAGRGGGLAGAFVWGYEPDAPVGPRSRPRSRRAPPSRMRWRASSSAAVALRRADHGVRVHAGDGAGQRSPAGLRRTRRRGGGARVVRAAVGPPRRALALGRIRVFARLETRVRDSRAPKRPHAGVRAPGPARRSTRRAAA